MIFLIFSKISYFPTLHLRWLHFSYKLNTQYRIVLYDDDDDDDDVVVDAVSNGTNRHTFRGCETGSSSTTWSRTTTSTRRLSTKKFAPYNLVPDQPRESNFQLCSPLGRAWASRRLQYKFHGLGLGSYSLWPMPWP